jgi:hypothetical protein
MKFLFSSKMESEKNEVEKYLKRNKTEHNKENEKEEKDEKENKELVILKTIPHKNTNINIFLKHVEKNKFKIIVRNMNSNKTTLSLNNMMKVKENCFNLDSCNEKLLFCYNFFGKEKICRPKLETNFEKGMAGNFEIIDTTTDETSPNISSSDIFKNKVDVKILKKKSKLKIQSLSKYEKVFETDLINASNDYMQGSVGSLLDTSVQICDVKSLYFYVVYYYKNEIFYSSNLVQICSI